MYSEIQEMFITMKFLKPLVLYFSKSNLTIDWKITQKLDVFDVYIVVRTLIVENP